jgi:hypothetical protein
MLIELPTVVFTIVEYGPASGSVVSERVKFMLVNEETVGIEIPESLS